ncbi:unnamed protein product [Periconia digitata]|uniref:Uncharacterized protein n=1 Tax=Periconia digitata TaxID=1303443 RepID=A0A9W4XXA1_9PLEO|nr:unnamed protein product [Periconia digitata]
MASTPADGKRRPPPIAIPKIPYPAIARPGPNAFAIAAQAKQDGASKHQETGDGDHESAAPRLPRASSTKATFTQPESTATTGLKGRARGLSLSIKNRHKPTPSSSNVSPAELQQAFDADTRTERGRIEAEKEHKYFKMMGQIPNTPAQGTDGPTVNTHLQTMDLRPKFPSTSKTSTDEGNDRSKGDKKKFLGVSLPSFKIPSNIGHDHPKLSVPGKTGRTLDISLPLETLQDKAAIHKSLSSAASHSTNIAATPPSDDPGQHTYQYRSYQRRPIVDLGVYTYSPERAHARKPSATDYTDIERTPKQSQVRMSSPESTTAPTPPQKDTPPNVGYAPAVDWIRKTSAAVPLGSASRRKYDAGKGMAMHEETMFALDPNYKSEPAYSPTKFGSYGAEDHAQLVEGEHIKSARADVDHASIESQAEYSQATTSRGQVGYRDDDEDTNEMVQLHKHLPGSSQSPLDHAYMGYKSNVEQHLEYLPATTYRPASPDIPRSGSDAETITAAAVNQVDDDRALNESFSSCAATSGSFSRSAQDLIQGPSKGGAARTTVGIDSDLPPQRSTPDSRHSYYRAPHFKADKKDVESSRDSLPLSDMLSGVSPSKIKFEKFAPPSAVPSPLHRQVHLRPILETSAGSSHMSSSQSTEFNTRTPSHPTTTNPYVESTGTRFTRDTEYTPVNENLDNAASTLYDHINKTPDSDVEKGSTSETVQNRLAAMQDHFASLKTQISSSGSNEAMENRLTMMEDNFEGLKTQISSSSEKEAMINDTLANRLADMEEQYEKEARINKSLAKRLSIMENLFKNLGEKTVKLTEQTEKLMSPLGQITEVTDKLNARLDAQVIYNHAKLEELGEQISSMSEKLENHIVSMNEKLGKHIVSMKERFEQQMVSMNERLEQQMVSNEQLEQHILAYNKEFDKETFYYHERLKLHVQTSDKKIENVMNYTAESLDQWIDINKKMLEENSRTNKDRWEALGAKMNAYMTSNDSKLGRIYDQLKSDVSKRLDDMARGHHDMADRFGQFQEALSELVRPMVDDDDEGTAPSGQSPRSLAPRDASQALASSSDENPGKATGDSMKRSVQNWASSLSRKMSSGKSRGGSKMGRQGSRSDSGGHGSGPYTGTPAGISKADIAKSSSHGGSPKGRSFGTL